MKVAKKILAGGLVALGTFTYTMGATLTTLVSFNGTNGASPAASLLLGGNGDYYGTTTAGGTNNNGTVFRVSPFGTLTTLYLLNPADGFTSQSGLTLGADGNYYGSANHGGSSGVGTIFRLTTNDVFSPVLSFAVTNGGFPIARMIQGQDRFLYGTSAIGGTNSGGTVFRLGINGQLSILASFSSSGNNGYSPFGHLLQLSDGTLYGTAFQGGTNGLGAIFKLSTNGPIIPVFSFNGTNGANPYSGLIQGNDGAIYGTTFFGGTNGNGTIFKLLTNGTLTSLVSFGTTNGANPQASLVQASDGFLYGVTAFGGVYTNQAGVGYGTIFRITTNGAFTSLLSFGNTNGATPEGGLTIGSDGNLYGTTVGGGTSSNGTVFRFTIVPPQAPLIGKIEPIGGTIQMTWSAQAGPTYQVQYTTNLTSAGWNDLGGTIPATNTIMSTVDSSGAEPNRFYRIEVFQ